MRVKLCGNLLSKNGSWVKLLSRIMHYCPFAGFSLSQPLTHSPSYRPRPFACSFYMHIEFKRGAAYPPIYIHRTLCANIGVELLRELAKVRFILNKRHAVWDRGWEYVRKRETERVYLRPLFTAESLDLTSCWLYT